jgi:hypothetical protein
VAALLSIAAALAVASGVAHAYVAWDFLEAGLTTDAVVFSGMAVPYLVGAVLLLTRVWLRWTIRIGIVYVILLIVVWLVEGARTEIAYATKGIEVALFAVLAILERRICRGS